MPKAHPDRGRIALLGLLVIAVVVAVGCGGPMRPHELEQSVDTILSSAREGQLLAEGVAKDSSKATFTRVRARELGEVIDHEAEKLDDADADGEVATEKRKAVDLCDQIGSELGDLQTSPTDTGLATEVEERLGHLSVETEHLRDSI